MVRIYYQVYYQNWQRRVSQNHVYQIVRIPSLRPPSTESFSHVHTLTSRKIHIHEAFTHKSCESYAPGLLWCRVVLMPKPIPAKTDHFVDSECESSIHVLIYITETINKSHPQKRGNLSSTVEPASCCIHWLLRLNCICSLISLQTNRSHTETDKCEIRVSHCD